jgi:hypothetical protein
MEAVRQALAELGREAKPLTLKEHILTKFAIDMPSMLISNYKSTILKKARQKRRAGRKPRALAAEVTVRTESGSAIRLEDIRTVKRLVDRFGATRVKELVEAVG